MATNKYNRVGDTSLVTVFTLIKGKVDEVAESVPEISVAIDASAVNTKAAGAKAVYDFVKAEIEDIGGIEFVKVDVLPASGEKGKIYLVPQATATTQNAYDEYIWYDNAWEKIGSTEMDLSGYVKSADMHELTATEVTTVFNSVWGD